MFNKKCKISSSVSKRYLMELQNKKTIMPTERFKMYKTDFLERHDKALSEDIDRLSAVITDFNRKKLTIWHCCNHDGYGYYTVSDGKTKRYVSSEYILECVGGCWSLHVYERLYFAQIYLTKFLKAVKAEIFKRFNVSMPIKSLYIAYILTDLEKEKNEHKDFDYSFDDEDKRSYEIAIEHQSEFIRNRKNEVEQYNSFVQNDGDYWTYYNGKDNYEYSCVSDILDKAESEIYKFREQLEACELWQESRGVISVLQDTKMNLYQLRHNPVIQTEKKQNTNHINNLIIGNSGSGKGIHPWDNLKHCPKCGGYPWIVGKNMKYYESGSPYTVICTNGKCKCKSVQSSDIELCIKDWNKKRGKHSERR